MWKFPQNAAQHLSQNSPKSCLMKAIFYFVQIWIKALHDIFVRSKVYICGLAEVFSPQIAKKIGFANPKYVHICRRSAKLTNFSSPQFADMRFAELVCGPPTFARRQWAYCYRTIKGQCHEIFCFWFFSWFSFPPAPEYSIKTVSNFFENSRRYSRVKVHHRYQRHRWQIFSPFSLALLIPAANLPPVSMIPAANLPPVSTTPVANCHRYQRHRLQICHRYRWHRWQIMAIISDCRHLKVNLKAKIYIYVNSTTQRCQNKII